MSHTDFINAVFLLTEKQDHHTIKRERDRRQRHRSSTKSGRGRHLREQAALSQEDEQ